MKLRSLFATLGIFTLMTLPTIASADVMSYFDPEGEFVESGLSTNSPTTMVLNIIEVLLSVLAIILVVLIVYAGFLILTSTGNEEKIQKGMSTIRWAIIGTIIIMSSLGITLYLDSIIT